jgi:hypothetical protein
MFPESVSLLGGCNNDALLGLWQSFLVPLEMLVRWNLHCGDRLATHSLNIYKIMNKIIDHLMIWIWEISENISENNSRKVLHEPAVQKR